MESVWWVFGELFKKGLVYRGFRVMPFSTALATPLSNFEANQDFQEVKDPWVIVNFPIIGEDDTYLVAWTTTPWTLPSNLALCVHPKLEYCRVKDTEKGCTYILMKARVCGKGGLYSEKDKKAKKFEIGETFAGETLVGTKYKPLFEYFVSELGDTAFRVVSDEYVTDESGVGVVHQAPAFGEDDYRVCLREGLVTNETIPCPVSDQGTFTKEVSDFVGQYIKDADKGITAKLKASGRLVTNGSLMHRDSFCWRSGTRLVRKTVDSWFVKVTDFIPDLLKSNDATYWVPNHVKEKRFHN
jgi:isoleucyl-tRNA synthetase